MQRAMDRGEVKVCHRTPGTFTDNRSVMPGHDRGLTYAVYHTEKPLVFEVFDNQGNIIGVGPWYRRDRHENYAKGSRVKNPGKNNQMR